MLDFDYSVDGLNAKNFFLRVNTVVYVEGDDDLIFWEKIFSKIPNFSFKIEEKGGSEELEKLITLVENGELNAIIARDADYLGFSNKLKNSDKIVYTLGYSIENTIYTFDALILLVRTWCRLIDASVIFDLVGWMDDFSKKFEKLLIQDAANFSNEFGATVLHDNCSHFMKSKNSYEPCPDKIATRIYEVSKIIPDELLEPIKNLFPNISEEVPLRIRGHFLSSAVARLIVGLAKKNSKKISLSADGLYVSAMTNFCSQLDLGHPHGDYYIDVAKKAALAVNG